MYGDDVGPFTSTLLTVAAAATVKHNLPPMYSIDNSRGLKTYGIRIYHHVNLLLKHTHYFFINELNFFIIIF